MKRCHATTRSRAAALYSVDEFRAALADWPIGGATATEPEVLKAHLAARENNVAPWNAGDSGSTRRRPTTPAKP